MQEEQGGEPGEDGFEGEDEGGVGGGRCCWAKLWMVKAAAVPSRAVTSHARCEDKGVGGGGCGSPSGRVRSMKSGGEADLEGGEGAGGDGRGRRGRG